MPIAASIMDLIGNTPLLNISRMGSKLGLQARLLVKLESMNPLHTVKDRTAQHIIEDAESKGSLKPGYVIIEATSGNFGIGLAFLAAVKGYKLILVMPDTQSEERKNLLKAMGASLIITPGVLGMMGAIEKARQIASESHNTFMPQQFRNEANPDTHRTTTGPEIWRDTDGQVDVFVSGVGTGGTITGVAEALKENKPSIHVVAVEPAEAPFLTEGTWKPHRLRGIGVGFIPKTLRLDLIDEILPVSAEDAFSTVRMLMATEGVLAGISSGAALFAAIQIARRPEFMDKTIVTLLPDTGERYLATDLFQR